MTNKTSKKRMVTIDDFAKLEFKVGTVVEATDIEGSDRLLKLKVDFGLKIGEEESPNVIANEVSKTVPVIASDSEAISTKDDQIASPLSSPRNEQAPDHIARNDVAEEQIDIRQILSGIKQWYKPEDLVNKQFIFITNLAPRKMMGLESQGMIMAAEGQDRPIPLTVSEKVPNGAKIR